MSATVNLPCPTCHFPHDDSNLWRDHKTTDVPVVDYWHNKVFGVENA